MISKVELVNFKVKPYTENFLPHSKKLQENQQKRLVPKFDDDANFPYAQYRLNATANNL